MISFLNSMFLVGLLATGIPVIIHLLHRRRRRVVRWGAMRFLLEAATRKRRLWNLRNLLLLLLRVAAIALFVLALAQPLLKAPWLAGAGERDVVLVIDRSMSTARTLSDESAFQKMVAEAGRLIDRLGEGDKVRVLLAGAAPEWITPAAVPASAQTKALLKRRLNELAPTLASADLPRCVQEAVAAEPAGERAARVVAVFTDGCAHGWRPEALESWHAVQDAAGEMAVPAAVNVTCVAAKMDEALNLSVELLTAGWPVAGQGETVRLEGVVKNRGTRKTAPRLLSWASDGEPLGVTALPPLEPGEAAAVGIESVFASPGTHRLTCRVERGDDLPPDDVGRYVLEIIDSMPVLVVDDSPHTDWLRTETGYLLAALGHGPQEAEADRRGVFRPRVINAQALASEDLSAYRCVVLADVSRLPEGGIGRLCEYVSGGGGLWVALGDRTDPLLFNDAFCAEETRLSPLPLAAPVGDPADHGRFVVVHPPVTSHRATRLLADTERLDVDRVRVYRRHCFAEEGGLGEVSVLLRTEGGAPLALEHVLGGGRVIVQAVPLSIGWSNLPARQAFVVLAHEWLWYLSEPSMARWNLSPGERFVLSLPERSSDARARVKTPRGGALTLASEVRDGRRHFSYDGALCPGDYELIVGGGEAGDRAFPFVVKRDVDESDLSLLSKAERETLTLAGGLRFDVDPLEGPRLESAEVGTRPLWSALLCALVVLMVAELLLGGHINRMRSAEAAPVEMNVG